MLGVRDRRVAPRRGIPTRTRTTWSSRSRPTGRSPSRRSRPHARLMVRGGRHGADLALCNALEDARFIASRYSEVVIASGSHLLRRSVRALADAGVPTTVACLPHQTSSELTATAAHVTWLERPRKVLGDAAHGRGSVGHAGGVRAGARTDIRRCQAARRPRARPAGSRRVGAGDHGSCGPRHPGGGRCSSPRARACTRPGEQSLSWGAGQRDSHFSAGPNARFTVSRRAHRRPMSPGE